METVAYLAETGSTNFSESGLFVVVGFCFVILVLMILAGITQFAGMLFSRPLHPAHSTSVIMKDIQSSQGASGEVSQAAAAPNTGEDEIDPQTMAVIAAAAIHAVIGDRPHRIIKIRPVDLSWAREGRRSVFSSHHVR